mmetsp:Transcript_13704/g.40012  ORF Transcript_13704/g.40012 Transcript_13704/m.40012 type:complete len:200 (+) Transcript_13704:711-1310(+)
MIMGVGMGVLLTRGGALPLSMAMAVGRVDAPSRVLSFFLKIVMGVGVGMGVGVLLARINAVNLVMVMVMAVARAGLFRHSWCSRGLHGLLVFVHNAKARCALSFHSCQNLAKVNYTEGSFLDSGLGVEGCDDLVEDGELVRRDQIHLVEQHHISALDLLHEQVHHRPPRRPIHNAHGERHGAQAGRGLSEVRPLGNSEA